MAGPTRTYPRYSVNVVITVLNKDKKLAGNSCNISLGGLCADINAPIDQGSDVRLELILRAGTSGEYAFNTESRVVWCTPIGRAFQCGLQFHPLAEADQTQLQKFLTYISGEKA